MAHHGAAPESDIYVVVVVFIVVVVVSVVVVDSAVVLSASLPVSTHFSLSSVQILAFFQYKSPYQTSWYY